jgi:hypothetical protein
MLDDVGDDERQRLTAAASYHGRRLRCIQFLKQVAVTHLCLSHSLGDADRTEAKQAIMKARRK